MSTDDQELKSAIEKLYAKELNLIAERPILLKQKWRPTLNLKGRVWARQSGAVKTAMVSLSLLLIAASVYYHNIFTKEIYSVRLESAQIEAETQRRYDLIPSLVTAVSNYMTYEGKVFTHASDVRNSFGSLKNELALPADAASASNFRAALSKFQAVAENYPNLKSSITYQNLMSELSNTETRLTMARSKYNISANSYNSSLEMVPGFFFAYLLGFEPVRTFAAAKGSKPSILK
ncbi:MAG: LemA family protein [Deltaproteobacteria bacterium]